MITDIAEDPGTARHPGEWTHDRHVARGHRDPPSGRRARCHPTKKLGQNFVVDANTVRKIVQAARVQPGSGWWRSDRDSGP